MKRALYTQLLQWKQNPHRKPLLLNGARQVGKTWLLKEFGKTEYPNFHHLDFDRNGAQLDPLFEMDLSPEKLLQNLSIFLEKKIAPETDLLIFDEIQNCPRALTSLKYFCEEMPALNLCAAGSLLGVSLSRESFPVGKVDMLHLYPMRFEEFLEAGGQTGLLEFIGNAFTKKEIPHAAHEKLCDLLKDFYVVGGMPQAVQAFLRSGDKFSGFMSARDVQKALVEGYQGDFQKHAGKSNALYIQSLFRNIPVQLARTMDESVTRFRFKDVIPGKKSYRDLEGPISWLVKAGLALQALIAERAELPLLSFCKQNFFKLYLFDIGILGAMLDLAPRTLALENYGMMRGFFVENFVAAELKAGGSEHLIGWSEGSSEIEFLLSGEYGIVPLEVKAGHRTKAKSLGQYFHKYGPARAIKLSQKNIDLSTGNVVYIPLYLAGCLNDFLTGNYPK
jgi:uncharacterized protein